jgi:hypothetical protein
MTKVEIIQRGDHVWPTGVVRRAGGDLEPLPESREQFSAELVENDDVVRRAAYAWARATHDKSVAYRTFIAAVLAAARQGDPR